MSNILILLKYKLLNTGREAWDNLFTLLILAPPILIVVWLLAVPYLKELASGSFSTPSNSTVELVVLVIIFLLLMLPLANIVAECYPTTSADNYLNSLPISSPQRFVVLVIMRLLSNLPLVAVMGGINYFVLSLAEQPLHLWSLIGYFLLPILLQLTALQLLLVLGGGHGRFLRPTQLVGLGVVLLALKVFVPSIALWLLLPFQGISNLLAILVNSWFQHQPTTSMPLASLWSVVISSVCLIVAFLIYQRWATSDAEVVEDLLSRNQRAPFINQLLSLIERLYGAKIRQLVGRDLLLSLRSFSAAVYISLTLAITFQIALIAVVRRYQLTGENLELTILAAGTLSIFCLAALTPALIRYQLAFLWLERSLPVEKEDIYTSKLCYSQIISLPAVVTTTIFALLLGIGSGTPFLSFKLLLIWWLVASFVGALSFEIITRPSLAIPFIAIGSLSMGSLVIRFWWIWFIIYPFLMNYLRTRAVDRCRVLLSGLEGDEF